MNPTINDVQILQNYKFQESSEWKNTGFNRTNNPTLLGVKEGRLVEVQSKDITTWNLFLRIFGLGNLGNTAISIERISSYLESYNFTNLGQENAQVLITIEKIAAKNFRRTVANSFRGYLYERKPSNLLIHNSKLTHTIHGRFYLTGSTTARDLHEQMFPWMELIRIDSNGVETAVKPTELMNSNILINLICVRNKYTGRLSSPSNSGRTTIMPY